MKTLITSAALAATLLFSPVSATTAEAACDAVCQQKCRATAHLGNMTVKECIARFAVINARGNDGSIRLHKSSDGRFIQKRVKKRPVGGYNPYGLSQ